MARLTDAQQRFIVQALACYDSPTEVSEAVKEEFGIEVERSHVAAYDPTKVAGRGLAKKWRDLFFATRERFRKEVAEIPIADQAYRLRNLGRLYTRAARTGNAALAAQLLEQAAREVGGAFTNRREHTGAGGGPIEQKTVVVDEAKVAAAVAKLEDDY
ncbi:DUF2280 domain-containing protein [Achromobacter aloeverae]